MSIRFFLKIFKYFFNFRLVFIVISFLDILRCSAGNSFNFIISSDWSTLAKLSKLSIKSEFDNFDNLDNVPQTAKAECYILQYVPYSSVNECSNNSFFKRYFKYRSAVRSQIPNSFEIIIASFLLNLSGSEL